MDTLEIRNEVDGQLGKKPDQSMVDYMAWKPKYANLPVKIGDKIVWRKRYWERRSMVEGHDLVVTTVQPKLEGYYYGTYEIIQEVKRKRQNDIQLKNAVVSVRR